MFSKIISFFMSIWIFICSLLGINIGKSEKPEMVEYSDDKKTVIVTLDENPSTGYMWEYDISDSGILVLKDSRYINTSSGNIAGAPGLRVFEFTAVSKGAAIVTLSYDRSWENQPVRTIVLKITAAEDLTLSAELVSDIPA